MGKNMAYILAARLFGGRHGVPTRLAWVLAVGCLCVAMTGCALWDGMEDLSDSDAMSTADASDLDATGDDALETDADGQSDIAEDANDPAAHDVIDNVDVTDVVDVADDADDVDDADDADDGSGEADLCAQQDGVCQGAVVSSADGVCTAADYGPLYVDGSDTRICDGLDNNCDGIVDFECCVDNGGQQVFLGPYEVGDGTAQSSYTESGWLKSERSFPAVVSAAPGAPEGATALVVWKQSATKILAQHIDRDGMPVGTPFNQSAADATAATVVVTATGYDLIWAEHRTLINETGPEGHENKIKIQALSPTLEKAGGQVLVWSETGAGRQLYRLTAAHHGGDVLVSALFAITFSVGGPQQTVMPLVYHTANRSDIPNEAGAQTRNFSNMRAIATSSGLLLAAHAGKGTQEELSKLWLWSYSSSDDSWTQYEFDNGFQDDTPFDLVQIAENEFLIIFSKVWGGDRKLSAGVLDLSVPSPPTRTVGSARDLAITSNSTQYAALSLFVRAANEDGFADQITLFVNEGTGAFAVGGTETEVWHLFAYPLDMQNLDQQPTPFRVSPASGGRISVRDALATAGSGSNLVAVWHTREQQGAAEKVVALPISFEGVRICPRSETP